nr:phage tail protein [Actinomadura sp. RB99]
MLPAAYQRADLPAPGQLARFISAAAAPLNLARSTAEGLRALHDAESAPPDFLGPLARWLGWEPDRTLPVSAQRNEITAAPHLYRSVGTVPGLRAIVVRYTGWDVRVAEMAQSIVRANQAPQFNVFALTDPDAEPALVTLEGAAGGRLSAFPGSGGVLRLFYEADRTVRVKTCRADGGWGDSSPVPTGSPAGGPAGAELPDGRIFLAWLDAPDTGATRLRFALATGTRPAPARLRTGHAAPFALWPGARLVVRVDGRRQGVIFTAADFADPANATAAEVVAVLNGRLTGVAATAEPDGTVMLATAAAGGDRRLVVETAASDAAGALGWTGADVTAPGDPGDRLDWTPPSEVPGVPPGRLADPYAVVDGPSHVRLFWSAHDGTRWTVMAARWTGRGWEAPQPLATEGGGNREPAAIRVDASLWLVWSRLHGGAADVRTLVRRTLDLTTGVWSAETQVTSVPTALDRCADREPAPIAAPGGVRVLFRSDRGGGADLWSVDLAATGGAPSEPVQVLTGPAADQAPAPVTSPSGTPWVLFRSDRGVDVGARASPPPGTGTLRRFAGGTTVVLGDAARIGRRRQWDDQLCYTPCKPSAGDRLDDEDLYTRGTVALFLSPLLPEAPLSTQIEDRLRPLLERFLPINVRAVLVFAPRVYAESVYPAGTGIEERYQDVYPFIEGYTGPADSTAAALPDWSFLLTNTLGHVAADPAVPTTLRRRAWYPPPS